MFTAAALTALMIAGTASADYKSARGHDHWFGDEHTETMSSERLSLSNRAEAELRSSRGVDQIGQRPGSTIERADGRAADRGFYNPATDLSAGRR
jgi:hypothetical protein